jgi:hypothetical protein
MSWKLTNVNSLMEIFGRSRYSLGELDRLRL